MFAPLRVPPCLTTSVAVSKALIKETGPLAIPPVEPTTSPAGRSRLKLKPVPPPLLCIMAASFTRLNIESRSSSIGKTKQADS